MQHKANLHIPCSILITCGHNVYICLPTRASLHMQSQISMCSLKSVYAEIDLHNYMDMYAGSDLGILVWWGCSIVVHIACGKNIGHAHFQ